MRTTLLGLALIVLSGCANTRETRRHVASYDAEKPTLLQRLGLGRPLGKKPPDDLVPAKTAPAQLQGIVVPDDPSSEIQPPREPEWKAGE